MSASSSSSSQSTPDVDTVRVNIASAPPSSSPSSSSSSSTEHQHQPQHENQHEHEHETDDESKQPLLASAKEVHSNDKPKPSIWRTVKNKSYYLTIAFIIWSLAGFSYIPLAIANRHIPIPVQTFYYGLTHVAFLLIGEFIPTIRCRDIVLENIKQHTTGFLWVFMAGICSASTRELYIVTLYLDPESALFIAFSSVFGYSMCVFVLHERIVGLRLVGIICLALASFFILVDVHNRVNYKLAQALPAFLMLMRIMTHSLVQPSIRAASRSGIPFSVSFQCSNLFGALFDFSVSLIYACAEGSWSKYYDAMSTMWAGYCVAGISCRLVSRLVTKYFVPNNDATVLVTFHVMATDMPAIWDGIFNHIFHSLNLIIGQLMLIPAFLFVSLTMTGKMNFSK